MPVYVRFKTIIRHSRYFKRRIRAVSLFMKGVSDLTKRTTVSSARVLALETSHCSLYASTSSLTLM